MSRGIGCLEELVVSRNWLSRGIGCRTRWLSHAMVVARNWLSRGIGCREELVVARNWMSPGIGCSKELVVARNWLSQGIGCRTRWLSDGIGCRSNCLEHGIRRNPVNLNLQDPFIHRHRTQPAANRLPHFLASYDTQGCVGDQILTRVPTGIAGIGSRTRW